MPIYRQLHQNVVGSLFVKISQCMYIHVCHLEEFFTWLNTTHVYCGRGERDSCIR